MPLSFQHHSAQHRRAQPYHQAIWRRPQHTLTPIPERYQPWLSDKGSLTQRLLEKSQGQLRVEVLHQTIQSVSLSERQALNMTNRQWAVVREVVLYGKGAAWVYARTVIPLSTLHGPLRRLHYLGNKPLGEQLFTDPSMRREPLEIAQLQPQQLPEGIGADISASIEADISVDTKATWGRRSVFRLSNKPLLVSEVFLPDLFA